jgi:hypothetical protein
VAIGFASFSDQTRRLRTGDNPILPPELRKTGTVPAVLIRCDALFWPKLLLGLFAEVDLLPAQPAGSADPDTF